jgi:hypothetical protein
MRLPAGAAWRLRAIGAEMNLVDSVYLGSGEIQPTTQIVLSGMTGRDGATVRWAIRREPARLGAKVVERAAAIGAVAAGMAAEAKPAVTEPESAVAPESASEAKAGVSEPDATMGGAIDSDAEAPEPDGNRKPPEGADDGA